MLLSANKASIHTSHPFCAKYFWTIFQHITSQFYFLICRSTKPEFSSLIFFNILPLFQFMYPGPQKYFIGFFASTPYCFPSVKRIFLWNLFFTVRIFIPDTLAFGLSENLFATGLVTLYAVLKTRSRSASLTVWISTEVRSRYREPLYGSSCCFWIPINLEMKYMRIVTFD